MPITVEDMCKRLRPVLGKKMDLLFLKYSMAEEREEKWEIEQALNVLYEKHLNTTLLQEKVLLAPPEADKVAGEYNLGIVTYADRNLYKFGLREEDLIRHVCITGMSGSGKTNFAFQFLNNFIEHKKPFLVFDWKKSFRPLLTIDPEIRYFTVGNDKISNFFKMNINVPPKGVGAKEWIGILCDTITESYGASFGVHKLLTETLDQAFKEFGVYKGSGNYPTWMQIKDRMEEREGAGSKGKSGREMEWLTSALRIAHSLTFGDFGEAITYKGADAMKAEEILGNKVIFELNSLNTTEKKFFCEFILTYIYKLKKSDSKSSTSKLKQIILVDEAHNIFLKERPNFSKESVTDMIYREVREYGIGLICLDQHISKISDTVIGNSACNICFQQMLPQDIKTASGVMQMEDNWKFFSMLEVGQGIVRLADRYHMPFLIAVPLVQLKMKKVEDEFIISRMKRIMGSQRIKKIQQKNIENFKKQEENLSKIYKITGVNPNSQKSCLSDEHKHFLQFLQKNGQGMPTAKLYSSLQLSIRKGNRIRDELIENRLIEVIEERDSKGRIKKIRLSTAGLDLLKASQK